MNADKQKTMTASRAARELGISREMVFKLIRLGKLKRAGYLKRGKVRNALLDAASVFDEKTRRKAAKSWRDGGMKVDTPAAKERRADGHQGKDEPCVEVHTMSVTTIEVQPDPRTEYTEAPELTEEQKLRAACLAARDSCIHHEEMAKTAASCSKTNAEHCREFNELSVWFAAISIGSAIISIIMAAICAF